jgi:hypothetical protein
MEWPNIVPLTDQCHGLARTYKSIGTSARTGGRDVAISLFDTLNLKATAGSASLEVLTQRLDDKGDSFSTLIVIPSNDTTTRFELKNCFLRQTNSRLRGTRRGLLACAEPWLRRKTIKRLHRHCDRSFADREVAELSDRRGVRDPSLQGRRALGSLCAGVALSAHGPNRSFERTASGSFAGFRLPFNSNVNATQADLLRRECRAILLCFLAC